MQIEEKERNLVIKRLAEALGSYFEGSQEFELVRQLEQAMFDIHGAHPKDYKAQYRRISFNLKDPKNQFLRNAFLRGSLEPRRLAEMDSLEMASEEMKETREKIALQRTEAIEVNDSMDLKSMYIDTISGGTKGSGSLVPSADTEDYMDIK